MELSSVEMPDSRALPPELAEVVRELDRDTRHVGLPTRSPRRKELTPDPYHMASYIRKLTTLEERTTLVEACLNVDINRLGKIPVSTLGNVLAAVDSENLVRSAQLSLPREKPPTRLGDADGEETVSFASLVGFVAERNSAIRSPFGGKCCIVNRLPLPPCCDNVYCAAHLSKPIHDTQNGASEHNLRQAALKIVFARHDKNGSGLLAMENIPEILDEHGVDYDARCLPGLFRAYNVDRSGALDFEEFSALLTDIPADEAVAKKGMLSYDLPPSLFKEFSKEAIEEMRTTFAMFDESGDGVLDEEKLERVLRKFGQEPTREKIHEELLRIDCDRSGTIGFQEFVRLMKKIRDGVIELDDSTFGRAVMKSVTANRLSQELKDLQNDPTSCIQSAKLTRPAPATLQARIACPNGTPYEGQVLTLELVAFDGYPFIPPNARLLERVFHLNLTILLDGSTALRSILEQWTAAWDIGRLLRELLNLLGEPDPSLLPDDLRRKPTALTAEEEADPECTSHGGNGSDRSGTTLGMSSSPDSCSAVGRTEVPSMRTRIRGGEGDLRETARSTRVMSRVAEMWYGNRARYEQMARRVAKKQLYCGHEERTELNAGRGACRTLHTNE